jgi:hypothetical protein
MTTRRRTILLAIPIFAALAFVPVINGHPKMGWIQVWAAYLWIFFCIKDSEWDSSLAVASIVIVAHVVASIGIASLLCRVRFGSGHGRPKPQPSVPPNGGPAECSGNSGTGGGPPSVS